MKLSITQIKYLLAIHDCTRDGRAQSSEVAALLGVSRPSVHHMLLQLDKMGLTQKQRYTAVRLSELGHELAHRYSRERALISGYMSSNLYLDRDAAEEVAVLLLGGMSDQTRDEVYSRIAKKIS